MNTNEEQPRGSFMFSSSTERDSEKFNELTIPDCCKEGWADCPHTPKQQKPKKQNIGL